jgi:hypothetical protein
VIGDRSADAVHRENVIVAHREMPAEVVGRNACVDVVRRVDEDLPAKDMR